METVTEYILRRLAEEGRPDLVDEYHAYSRQYQRYTAIKSQEHQIEKWKMRIAGTPKETADYQRLVENLERDEAILERWKQGVEK